MKAAWAPGYRVDASPPLEGFLASLFLSPLQRVPGTAVFLTSTPDATPNALLHSLKHYKVLHERVILLTVRIEDVPYVTEEKRLETEVQKLTDEAIKRVDETLKTKEQEIMHV